jgi:peptidoglycan/xylan/chitin deacetylase (PgdA/CDA1 family)
LIRTRKFLLTFDVEDFINPNAIYALKRILNILEKYKVKAIFFITGHMAEKLSNYPAIMEMLSNHEIGYHSSSHSVHPTIPEYTDVKNYQKAYETSIQRETSHVNPLTGKLEREGGIYFLQDLFPNKKIQAFRAPGMCWTPPNLEALKSLGIRYDFSSKLTLSEPVLFKGIVFYPFTILQEWDGSAYKYECILYSILKNKVTVLDLHPTLFVNKVEWDSIYYRGNPKKLVTVPERSRNEIKFLFSRFELLIKRLKFLQRARIIDINSTLETSNKCLTVTNQKVNICYEASIQWSIRRFNYYPKFIRKHFYEFFNENADNLRRGSSCKS